MTIASGFICPIPLQALGSMMWIDGNDPNGNGIYPGLGDSIALWKDKTGIGNSPIQSTGVNQPFFVGPIGGIEDTLWGVNFQINSPSFMSLGDIFNFPGTLPYSFIFAIAPDTLGITQAIISKFNSGISGQWMLYINSSNKFVLKREVSPFTLTSTTSADGSAQIISCVYDGTNMFLYVNGNLEDSAAFGSVTSNSNPVIIGGEGAGNYLTGYILEGIFSVIGWSSAQRQLLERYLANRWGISL